MINLNCFKNKSLELRFLITDKLSIVSGDLWTDIGSRLEEVLKYMTMSKDDVEVNGQRFC